jgi:hypothetical protein
MKKTHFIVNNSWMLGKVGQVENKLLASLRNLAFRAMPASMNDRLVKMLYELDF